MGNSFRIPMIEINFQVGVGKDDFRVEQLEADAVNLNSNFVYIMISITVELTWIWRGAGK